MRVFEASSYKQVLRHETRKPKTFSAMAEHCQVQKTYLSKVLNQDAHLNDDQMYLACDYLELSGDERHFALLLHAWERAQVRARRHGLEQQIEGMRAQKLKTEANLSVKSELAADLTEYYLDPLFQISHMLLTLQRFRNDSLSIGRPLGLPERSVRKCLKGLERMGLIRLKEGKDLVLRAEVLRDNLHLGDSSPLHSAYSARMRLKAIERLDQLDKTDGYSFSVVFSTNPKVRNKIHASFVAWLKTVQTLVQDSAEEEVYQMNFDLLKWS